LKKIYAILKADGDVSVIDHLYIDRVDLCVYGNTKPFRVRIVNRINDLFDYYYVKIADASRIYGLDLEHFLSPNKINYIVEGDTLIEEHIQGIPGDDFIKLYLNEPQLNEIRLAKEFVKFNERCLVRLLGDMHATNFVVEIIPDFDEIYYRIRAIDFDQQSYEGRRAIYMPQYFKQNNPIIKLGLKHMKPELEQQYRQEERSLIATRVKSSGVNLYSLLNAMTRDTISPTENVERLKKDLAKLYGDDEFLKCVSMGEIVKTSLKMVFKHPLRDKYQFAKKTA
jgi:predicted unusual protein kinase regulating ubiquinone biosynthesis (AarF/ABC1/UbiB family)